MNFNFVTVTPVQQQLFLDALGFSVYPFDDFLTDVTVDVDFDGVGSPDGHKDYRWTIQNSTTSYKIGGWPDLAGPRDMMRRIDPAFNNGDALKRFFMEAGIHEIGHVLHFHAVAIFEGDLNSQIAPLLEIVPPSGDGPPRAGTRDDMNPRGSAWENREQEGVAEALKDSLLPDEYRYYENRTNWGVPKDNWNRFITLLMPCETTGGGGDS